MKKSSWDPDCEYYPGLEVRVARTSTRNGKEEERRERTKEKYPVNKKIEGPEICCPVGMTKTSFKREQPFKNLGHLAQKGKRSKRYDEYGDDT